MDRHGEDGVRRDAVPRAGPVLPRALPEHELRRDPLDGQRVGRLYVSRWSDEIRIVDIALLPDSCNRGIGTTLLRQLQAEAHASGKPLRIHVERFNPALRLYERLGFREIADRGVYLFMEWSGEAGSRQSSVGSHQS